MKTTGSLIAIGLGAVLFSCLPCSARAQTSGCVVPPAGLVGWWPGDGNADNLVGPSGTLENSAGFAAGQVGQAFDLDGQTQYVATDLDAANNTITQEAPVYAHFSTTDGDWDALSLILHDTPEADLMVRTGDIDNLGFGWPTGFDPFSGNSTPAHAFPWSIDPNDPPGTDRIMVITSYNGHPPAGRDGYTSTTSRPANNVHPIELDYDLGELAVRSAVLQMFVDDFQAPVWHATYQVTLNGVRAPFLETIINALNQTGPIGKLISVALPAEFLPQVQSGSLVIDFDDPTTGAGDGYAIDFVKLLVNLKSFTQEGTIEGTVRLPE
ncbi:MAG: hypothetical protein M1608_00665 [Candidatus Omnitrophica bacterium]|nr:hypothetical protein [Candidatus Omnitrophota bacterium]